MSEGGASTNAVWFVGASFRQEGDQADRFIEEGIWELKNPSEWHRKQVLKMQPGERIVIKATYVRKHDLPFDNRGQSVSVMGIKAVGTITDNPMDGERVSVSWSRVDPIREWYFYTYRGSIWRVVRGSGDWRADALIDFIMNGSPQDLDRFRNHPYWRERFGDVSNGVHRFRWTPFYEAIASALLGYRDDRASLLEKLREATASAGEPKILADDFQYSDGSIGPLPDICPFTVMGLFNRGLSDVNRKKAAREIAAILGVTEPVPQTFEGIPILNNLNSWFFSNEKNLVPEQFDLLWEAFERGLEWADVGDEESSDAFLAAYDRANECPNVGWKLTIGLYWARPWSFVPLDSNSRSYITQYLNQNVPTKGPKNRASAHGYVGLIESLESKFEESSYPVHSFPELSLEAWRLAGHQPEEPVVEEPDGEDETTQADVIVEPYAPGSILQDGGFLELAEIERLLERLRTKKNVILQGPPGTGKTWLAKRLAFALMGEKDEKRLRAVQFHPNLSYEDFVRGWRPVARKDGDARLELADGVLMQAIDAAKEAPPKQPHVVVIEEINRGNPAQIFGEMLTLLEAGKRTPSDALELSYRREPGERVHVPENLYIIGTMNIADRSLAMVDFALRRRFAFVDLEPKLGALWRNWVVENLGVDAGQADEIQARMRHLNETIAADPRLGKQFCVGHSYVTPSAPLEAGTTRPWFEQVVETEIGPLLEEYWFDAPDEAEQARDTLLAGW
ncbi:McrB family protein [Guyparkeria sp.]|uniref:McrB family protein n=1 Tax=Guyparkeria sp. TaxID=2035736 RepID=UPI003970D90D